MGTKYGPKNGHRACTEKRYTPEKWTHVKHACAPILGPENAYLQRGDAGRLKSDH